MIFNGLTTRNQARRNAGNSGIWRSRSTEDPDKRDQRRRELRDEIEEFLDRTDSESKADST